MLTVTGLGCERGGQRLFHHLNFFLQPGQVMQIEGPNGVGKSTLLKILCGLYTDFVGEVHWRSDDYPLYLSHKPGIKDLLTVTENLRWLCELQQQPVSNAALEQVLQQLDLSHCQHFACGQLSEGQRKRVNLARYFLLERQAWLLDEPFSALDATCMQALTVLLTQHVNKGGMILLTSHQRVHIEADLLSLQLAA